jgi:23S rRNA (adenine2503-C2)-methyltransferase
VKLGKELCVNLAISLNAPDDRRRDELMPVNRKYPLRELLAACRDYPMPGRRMLTFEYILMAGVNDSPADAEKLARLLRGLRCKLNLIAFNEFPAYFTGLQLVGSAFQQVLLERHYTAILRASRRTSAAHRVGAVRPPRYEQIAYNLSNIGTRSSSSSIFPST